MLVSRRSIFLALLCVTASLRAQPASFSETVPFVSGQDGYHTYRIPAAIRSLNCTVLAFCEGRKNSGGDAGDIDIVLRRSTNNGATWLPMTLVQEEGGNASITIGNPAPVVDETTGHIHLLFCRNNSRVFHIKSTDDGLTWSPRMEITTSVKLSTWGWYATGPGHGIQLKRGNQAGRLVIPSDHNTTNGINGAQVVYSDDQGATWQLGAVATTAGEVRPNETLGEELVSPAPNGGSRIYFNTRDQNGSAPGTRGEAWSDDGGISFVGPFTNHVEFVCPVVQGSVVRLRAADEGDAVNHLLFSCPNHASSRVTMSVWSSLTEGVSWGEPKLIYAGPSAYSDLVRLGNGEVGLLYERGASSPYQTITFARFNEAWLDAGTAPAENPRPAFWNFEERSPGQAASTNASAILDIHPAGAGKHLTAQQAFAYSVGDSNFGNGTALTFDGSGGLQIPDAPTDNHFDFGVTNSFTIEAGFRIPSGSTQVGALVAKDFGPLLPSWWFRVDNGKLRFLVCDGVVERVATAAVPLVNDGQWHHAAAVRDARIPAQKVLRLYLDGVLLTNIADTTTQSLANNQPLNVGRFGNSSTRNLTGDMDFVRITPGALAPADFIGRFTQFDADADLIPDAFERTSFNSLETLSEADADNDGFPDAVEFAFGTDALAPDSEPQLLVAPGATTVTVTTRQRSLPAWLEVQLESSPDLHSWQPAPGIPVLTPLENNIFERRQTLPYPAGAPEFLFLRLHLNRLP
jgi:sialidase-1